MSETNSKLYFRVALLALLLPLASGDCSYLDLGMESRSIPDSKITASSVQNASTPASNSRLNFASGSSWCAGTSDSNPYLQIDLQTLHIICAVSTQGNSQADQWVKSFTLQSSIDGSSWKNYSEIGQLKSLKGNEDRNSEVKHILNGGVLARYLRLLPETYNGGVCLRTEVFGVKQKPDNLALGKPTKQSSTYSDAQIGTAESGRAVDGNADTDMGKKHCSHTKKNNPSWWRVDLALNHTAVYEIHIVNRFTGDPGNNNVDYKITFGSSTNVASNPECTGRYSFIQFKASAICFTNPLTTGRYVGIMTTKKQSLQLCEVEIYSRENLAFGKQTNQISTTAGGLSTRGVDGNSETDYHRGSSCTHTKNVKNAWWRVDLGQDEPVSEVYIVNRAEVKTFRLNNFEIRVGKRGYGCIYLTNRFHVAVRLFSTRSQMTSKCGSDSSNGGVKNPKCGGPFSVPGGKGLSFFCRPPLYGKYVTIRTLRQSDSALTLCEVEVYSERRACQIQALGISSKDAFPDNSFSAFSSSGSGSNVASKGRLNGIGAWSPSSNNNPNDFLQINLQYEFFICAVATQGKPTEDHWTTKYKILLSLNNIDWVTYKENGTDKVFDGNSGRNDIVKHNLKEIARARFIRFLPITYSAHKALRVEVFGILKPAAPSQAPSNFVVSALSSTSVRATWQLPPAGSTHGAITGFKLLYQRKNSPAAYPTVLTIQSNSSLSRNITGLRKYTEYEFQVLAFSYVGNGPKTSVKEVTTDEDEPSVGPDNVTTAELNGTTYNISWAPLTREKSFGKVIMYDIKEELLSRGRRRKRSPISRSRIVNTTSTFVVLYDLPLCSQYHVSVRAFTKVGPGPYTQPMELERSIQGALQEFKATSLGTTQVTLEWKEPNLFSGEGLSYIVKYLGSKRYNQSFIDEGIREAHRSTTYTVRGLVPGSIYKFEVYVCENSVHAYLPNDVKTKTAAPIAPVVLTLMEKEVSQSSVQIHLWPVEQRNGPISVYQVIVLKVVDGTEELPNDYPSKLKDNANEDNLNFYVAAEIQNVPVHEESWEFTVGDGKTNGGYVNKGLETGQDYVVYQRALTYDEDRTFSGEVSKVARISVNKDVGGADKTKGTDSANAVAIAVPVVLLILLIPAVLAAVYFYRRRKRSENKSSNERATPLQLEDLRSGSADTTSSTANLVYQNLVDIRPSEKGTLNVMEASSPKENELIYSEAEDGKPKPIPVAEFARYFKSKSENGAIVLREEFKNLPGGMQFPWEIGKNNKMKNRYGNITTYDHSRVVLEKIEGDPKSDYINASYIPTFDEETMCYIATQGPTSVTISDFWRMIWQEKCATIVMLTNLVEVGKGKCDQYWPDNNTKFGSIRVTLKKTENFADYVVRRFILVKEQEKREVLQFHYVTWPDKGVPQRSSALLGFRWKVHARHQATGGPLVVHCSAGVGRTGTYIGIDAMLEGAKEKKSVFIQNYIQVMRRCRPHMVQKEEQYVFLHQAVMEALTCGNTEVAPQDLRIAMNKLARTQKSSKQTGYEREFKRLQLVSDCQVSGEESKKAFDSSNTSKNRFPNIVPLDSARVFLRSSDPQKDYINASFVDDYKRRNAYILTQAPLNNTVEDFWRMISQYDIGTVVMLNSLGEDNENYPQYWPAKGSVEYGDITIQILSESTSNKITTRRFSVLNVEPPKKQSTVQHLHFTGWSSPDSCPDPQEILDLLTTIQQSQQQTGNGVIVFQCSDGVGRSGCVSSIMSAIERVKSEQTVDVFQTVKLIRARKPGAVDTLEKYVFCYKTILAYLDSFNAYANFADC